MFSGLKRQLQQAQQQLVQLTDGDVREKANQLVQRNLKRATTVAETGLGASKCHRLNHRITRESLHTVLQNHTWQGKTRQRLVLPQGTSARAQRPSLRRLQSKTQFEGERKSRRSSSTCRQVPSALPVLGMVSHRSWSISISRLGAFHVPQVGQRVYEQVPKELRTQLWLSLLDQADAATRCVECREGS